MKKIQVSILIFGFFLLGMATANLYPTQDSSIHFGSRESAIKVSSGAKLNVGSTGLSIDGTLAQASGATVAGQTIAFDNGLFEYDGASALLTGNYVPSTTKLNMVGSSVFKFEPGTVVPGIIVTSTDNRLEGQPIFSGAVTLTTTATRLTVALHSTLNKNISLHSGRVTLDNDLALADDVHLVGPGTIDLNNRQLTLGGHYTTTWDKALTLINATGIYLTGRTALDSNGHWTFSNTSRINGNGEMLDLSAGGQITIAAGQKLYMEDIVINGLGTNSSGLVGRGKINFGSATSELHLSNATLVIDTDVEIASGKVIVDGPLTIVLKGNILNFKTNGTLRVNGTVVWLEPLDRVTYPDIGYLRFGTGWDIYDANGFNQDDTDAAIAAGLLVLSDNALIKKTTAQTNLDPSEQAMLSATFASDVTLKRDFTIASNQFITINDNITIDGNGSTLTFAGAADPQFVIRSGKTVVLKNIELSKIHSNTFSFGTNSHLHFGENVTLELVEDVTFASNTIGSSITPLLRILDAADGANTLTVRGLSGKCSLTFQTPIQTNLTQRPIQMGDNVLSLENVACAGLDDSINTPGIDTAATLEYPAVNLVGNATINVYGKKTAASTSRPTTSLDIFVEGEGNRLNLGFGMGTDAETHDGIDYRGMITYGSMPINELFVTLNTQNLTTSREGRLSTSSSRLYIEDGYPYVTLSGTGIGLYSPIIEDSDPVTAVGVARLVFTNDNAAVEIYDPDAFQIDTGAELLAKGNLHWVGNKLKQNSHNVIIGGTNSNLKGDIDVTGARSFHKRDRKSMKDRRKIHTLEFEKRRALEEQELRDVATAEASKEVKAGVDSIDENVVAASRALSLPTVYDGATVAAVREQLQQPFARKIAYKDSTLSGFTTFTGTGALASDYAPFNLVLENNNRVILASTNMKLYRATNKSDSQLINITGTGNEIYVNRTFTFKSNLFMGAESELTFVFVNDGSATPTVVLDSRCLLELEKNATLRFKGDGKVILSDDVLVYFRGTADTTKNRTSAATNKPRFILTDGAVLDFARKAEASFAGYGYVEVSNGAMIAPSTVGSLSIGAPQTYVAAISAEKDPTYTPKTAPSYYQLDDFDVVVKNNGEIRLDLPASLATTLGADWTTKARVGILNATASISFGQGGMLTVGNNALFDLNADARQTLAANKPKTGRIRDLSFGYNGLLYIKAGGLFTIAANVLSPISDATGFVWNGQALVKSQEVPFIWLASQARMGGAGAVQYVAKKTADARAGTFAPTKSALLADDKSIKAKELVANMIS